MRSIQIAAFAALALCTVQSFAETHTVTFRRMNGTVLSKVEVEHGGAVALPDGPDEADHEFKGWDHGDWLGCVTNDIQVWALYEGTKTWTASKDFASENITFRDEPYSLDEYFKMYDNLAWADEFSRDGTNGVNRSYWDFDTENRHQLNLETSGDNQKEHDGNLVITVRREHAVRQSWWGSSGQEYDFTGGGILSKNKVAFHYGRCEIRAKLTRQRGCWPAFWMMGNTGQWPACGELDILEQPSGGDWVAGTFHINPPSGSGSIGSGSVVTPQDGVHFGDGYHRFGTIMNEREVVWYVDDHIFKRMDVRDSRYKMCHDRPWFIIFGMGIQTNTWVQAPDAPINKDDVPELISHEDFMVDYCRIYTNTNEDNTVAYEVPAPAAKLSAPVKATVWRGWDMCWGRTGAGSYQSNIQNLNWMPEVDYIKKVLTKHLAEDQTDVLTFLTEPSVQTGQNRGEFDIPGYTMMSISFNGNQWNNWDNAGSGNMGRTQLFGNALFNRDRFSASESGVDFMTLSSDPAFTNCYAMCADLKEKATGARVKVVSVNVTTTNGIENASGTVAQGFDTLFAKLNAMKDDHVIVFFQGMDQKRYNYIKARAASSLQSPYALVGKVESWDVYQCSYATANRSATAARVAKIPFVKSNLAASYSQNPQALQAKVVFDELPDDGFADTFVESDYARSMDVTFTGYSGSTLANFPVLVRLSTAINGFRYSDFRLPNGGDLRFTDASGNVLPHEIDTWNPSGESTVWVKVPSLQANAKIVAHYRCTRPVRVDSAQVWDSNYVGVWHLGESALPLKESCGVSVDFTHSSGETVGYGAQGIVGGSVDFANGPSNAVVALDHDALDGFSRFTIEAWTKQSAHKSNAGILSKRETYQNNVAYYMYDGNGPTVLNVGTNNNCNPIQASNAIRPTAGAWAHQAYTVDMKASVSNVWGYLNGESTAPKSVDFVVTVVSNRIGNLTLGNLNANAKDNSFNGLIDEVRISKSVRSAAWIKATHDTVAIADFATYEVAIPEVPTAFASDSAGFDYTNRVVTVTNATAGATLTLTATAPGGTTTTATATVNENGEATFDIPTAPGEAYSYEVAMDGDIIASGGFFTGGWGEEAEWFSASARTGASEVSGGVWKNTPTVANGKYAVDGTADFVLSSEAVAAGLNRFVRIDFDYSFDAICDESELADGDSKLIGGFTAAANSTSAGFWMAYGTDGWIPLYGDVAPEEAREYVVRAEVDTSAVPPQTSYAVRADGGDAFSPLFVDEARTARWVAGAVQSEAVTGVEFDGQGSVASVCGSLANANIAEADGVGYASLADAIASATNSLVLLTNATWPTNTPVGTVSVDRGDFALAGVTLDGDGNVVVPSGFSSIPNVGKINITLEQAASLGVATAGKSPAQIAEALAANGDNGIPRWESYVLGLDPTKPDAKPKATIVMNGENVELALVGIDVNEDAGATVTYRVYKFSDLANIEEEPVGGDLAPGATAEIPKDATEPKMFYRLKIDVKGY